MEELELGPLVIGDELANPLFVGLVDVAVQLLPLQVGSGLVTQQMPFVGAQELEFTGMARSNLS